MTPIKPAAAVVCIRETPQNELEVLLLRRNRKVKFASGFWVFPGGKIEEVDFEGKTDKEAAKSAAIREAKEEANLELTDNEMNYFCHWTTPAPSIRRFSTWFFLTHIEYSKSDVIIDDSEIKEYSWLSPKEALEGMKTKKVILMPPTFLVIQRIRHCQKFLDTKKELMRGAPQVVKPRTAMLNGVFQSLYPGDAGYDSHNPSAAGSRHRLTGDMKTGLYAFEYHGCNDHFPLNGGHFW